MSTPPPWVAKGVSEISTRALETDPTRLLFPVLGAPTRTTWPPPAFSTWKGSTRAALPFPLAAPLALPPSSSSASSFFRTSLPFFPAAFSSRLPFLASLAFVVRQSFASTTSISLPPKR